MDCFGVEIGFLGEREGHGLPTCSPNEKKILKNGVFIFVVSFFIFISLSLWLKKRCWLLLVEESIMKGLGLVSRSIDGVDRC